MTFPDVSDWLLCQLRIRESSSTSPAFSSKMIRLTRGMSGWLWGVLATTIRCSSLVCLKK